MPDRGPSGSPPSGSPSIEPVGDAGLLISLGSTTDPDVAAWAQAIAAAIDTARAATPAIGRPVPAHASVLVPFDPLAIELEDAIDFARQAVVAAEAGSSVAGAGAGADDGPVIEIPVRYGGPDGPDLDAVAGLHGLRPDEVVDLHASARYHVLFLGFGPGFGYLGGLPAALVTPRRASPRERVPAGSVGIAGEHTAVYPLAMPGGWQLIGRTDRVLFDPDRPDPALLRPGATVRFVPLRDE
ncbi:MAG TPA: 5-oxoprolinase subunit PxpB [Candidatus Limnocylindrales bacterium]|nr:5-oxoprolinase subunit PxpB [Candidatus Limnocylindrales bacterium]